MLGGSPQFTHLGPETVRGASKRPQARWEALPKGEGRDPKLHGGMPKSGRHWSSPCRMNGPAKTAMAQAGSGNEWVGKAAAVAQMQFVAAQPTVNH